MGEGIFESPGGHVCRIRVVIGQDSIAEKSHHYGRQIKLKQASQNTKQELDRFVENTLEYAKKEKDILLGTMEIPAIETHVEPPCVNCG